MSKDFGKAEYVRGRNRKNSILVYTSRTERKKVYEFMIAAKFKIPGLVSWKCVSCMKIKNDYRTLGNKLNKKIPLILVDNDIIKEDPERPLNGEHFCNGKDALDTVVNRAKMEFIARHEDDNYEPEKLQKEMTTFMNETLAAIPVQLTAKEDKIARKSLNLNCIPFLHSVQKRRLRRQHDNEHEEQRQQPSTSTKSDRKEIFEQPEEETPKKRQCVEKVIDPQEKYIIVQSKYEPIYTEKEATNESRTSDVPEQNVPNDISRTSEDLILGNMQDVAYDIELV